MTVQDLRPEQLEELKEAFFWGDETQDILPEYISSSEQIPDDIIFDYYAGITFTNDDFFSSFVESIPLHIPF